jgi:hypothetical protein
MRFSIYGRYEVDIERRAGRWVAFRRGPGTRREDRAIVVPADLHEDDLATYLDDLLHEEAVPGQSIRRIS